VKVGLLVCCGNEYHVFHPLGDKRFPKTLFCKEVCAILSKKTGSMLRPQYVGKFQCIGPDCEDCCCVGWRIQIDKKTYQLYRKCPDKELQLQMSAKVTRTRTNATDANYAKIKLDHDGSCPFLTEEKLCAIQRKLGEQYLSVTCTSYPRLTNCVNGILEQSLTLSCPEAARLALLPITPMEFDEIEPLTDARYSFGHNNLETADPKLAQRPEKYFWELRIFIITLLQNRSYPVWQRLVILGLFCQKISALVGEGKAHDIPRVIDTYSQRVVSGSYKGELETIDSNVMIQVGIIIQFINGRVGLGITNRRFWECYEEFLQGIQYKEQASPEEIAEYYSQVWMNYYQPFMAEHEYILENYLVNRVFLDLFPLGNNRHIFDNYVMLIVQYAMIKLLLVGSAGFYKEDFSLEHVLKVIQSFSRVIEHDKVYLSSVFQLIQGTQCNNMAYMAALIKN
jgi:lysine-N-methylase